MNTGKAEMFKNNNSRYQLLFAVLLSAAGQSVASEQPVIAQPVIELVATELAAANSKWYERSFEQLLETKVVTATRDDRAIADSPATMSVYTEADIKRMGIRSVKELLERTTGFFMNKQYASPAMGSRGYISDNEQFLLLIDGHNANSIVDKGPGNFFLFPFLEHVKRVEIQRGPGSTLWGSDAAMGIIHIITQDGSDFADSEDGNGGGGVITASYSSEDHQRYLNYREGEQFSEGVQYMLSLSAAQSDGFDNKDIGFDNQGVTWEAFDDSWELYFKGQMKDTKIHARFSDVRNLRPGGSMARLDEDAYSRRRHSYMDIQRSKELAENFSLEGRLFADLIERWQSQVTPVTSPGTSVVEESAASKETGLGLELLGRWQPVPEHRVLLGTRVVYTEVDPVSNNVTYPVTSVPSSAPAQVDIRVVPEDTDENYALFAEDDWAVNDKLNLIFGLRVDRNTLREENTIVLPRFAANLKINPRWSAQYGYSTGYIRPPVGIGFLGQGQYNDSSPTESGRIYGASDSQEVISHDIRISYNRKPFSAKWNLYHTTIEDSFNFLYEPDDSFENILFYVNTPEINTYGTELEFNYVPSERWNLYGNLSYVIESEADQSTGTAFGIDFDLDNTAFGFGEGIFTKDGTVVGYPQQIMNLGVNFFHGDHLSTNIHLRGWNDLVTREPNPAQKELDYGPEFFLDANIRYREVAATGIDVSLFAKNLLDNDDADVGMLLYTQPWQERGRSLGLKLSYQF